MNKKILLYLVLPFSVAFVLFTVIVAMYVNNLLTRHEVETGNLLIIYGIGAGMFLCLLKVAALSLRVTKPLDKMKAAALDIKEGNYTAQTGVRQRDEIGELASILDDMARQLSKASDDNAAAEARRREFVANISHELRTPITVIRGSLEALADGVVTDAQQVAEYYRQMHTESIHMERLVTDLFDLARLQSTEFAIEFADVDMREVVRDAVRTMTPIAAEKGIALPCPDTDASHYIPPIQGDYGRLRQLLIAILDNAIKFTPPGKSVTVTLSAQDERVCVTVSDEGGGIAGEDLPRIFQRFYRTHTRENPTGTGLGLPIAKQIADRHGAEIHVASEVGSGTTVTILFI